MSRTIRIKGLAERAQRTATRRYRAAIRRRAAALPAGSDDAAVAVFESLQAEAWRARGWRGLAAAWLAEARALRHIDDARPGHAGPSHGARQGRIRMTTLRHDVRDAWRALRRAPAYATVVIATLALGIGANTAIFSVVDALLLRDLPYAEADRLVRVAEWPRTGGNFTVAPAAFLAWRPAAAPFLRMEAVSRGRFVLTGAGTPQTVSGASVTPGYFALLQASAAEGRLLAPGDDAVDAPCRAVVSHRLRRDVIDAARAAVGATVTLSDTPCTIVGVLPAGSVFDRLTADVYLPLVFTPTLAAAQGRNLTVIGRLAEGVPLDQARERLAAVAAAFNATRGPAGDGWSSALTPWRDVVVRTDTRRLVWILFGAVALVLAIACANVAGLAVSRVSARRRELGIRAALGAGRWRLMQYLTVESLLLSLAGGGAGVLVGLWALEIFLGAVPSGVLPPETVVRLDARALAFTAGLSVLTAIVFGTAPAWQASRAVADSRVVADGRTQSSSRFTSRLHAGLVVGEIALATVLIAGAVLLVTSFVRLGAVDPGFAPAGVLTAQIGPSGSRYGSAAAVAALVADVNRQLRATPGITASAAVTSLPLGGWLYGTRFTVEGRPDDPERPTNAHIQHASDGYFETLGLAIVDGRGFTPADSAGAQPVAVVNETFATRYLGEGPRVGRQLRLGVTPTDGPADALWTIVGVVADVKTGGLADAALQTPEIYVPHAQSPVSPVFLAVRGAALDAAALEGPLRDAVASVDPDLPVDGLRTMNDRIGLSVRLQRFRTTMIAAFAILAALLAGFGIYAVRARAVVARRREMGIRLALGATRRAVLAMVLRQGLRLAIAGAVIGLAGALALARTIDAWLFETTATDPSMLAGALLIVAIPAVLASWVPARRAAAVDPIDTLRGE